MAEIPLLTIITYYKDVSLVLIRNMCEQICSARNMYEKICSTRNMYEQICVINKICKIFRLGSG